MALTDQNRPLSSVKTIRLIRMRDFHRCLMSDREKIASRGRTLIAAWMRLREFAARVPLDRGFPYPEGRKSPSLEGASRAIYPWPVCPSEDGRSQAKFLYGAIEATGTFRHTLVRRLLIIQAFFETVTRDPPAILAHGESQSLAEFGLRGDETFRTLRRETLAEFAVA